MTLYHFIKHESGVVSNRIVFMLIFSGLATGMLISVINRAVDSGPGGLMDSRILFLYLAIFLLYIYTQKYSLSQSIYPLNDALYRMRLRIIEKIILCEPAALETMPKLEIQDRLSREINLATQLAPWISYSAQAAVILLFCLLYLAWISMAGFLIITITLTSAALWHLFVEKQVHHEFREMGAKELEFSSLLDTLLSQGGEISREPLRGRDFLERAGRISREGGRIKTLLDRQTISSIMSVRIVLFLLLGIFIFIIPMYDPGHAEVIFKITVLTFFIMSPLTQLIYALPLLLRLDSALVSIYALEKQLDSAGAGHVAPGMNTNKFALEEPLELRLVNLKFTHDREEKTPPLFENLNLGLRAGDVILLHGEMGAGKTTLLKLLCGMYPAVGGAPHVGRRRVKSVDYPYYRRLFACLFADGEPPRRLYREPPPDFSTVHILLEKFGLEQVVDYEDGQFQYAPLSRQQQQRLRLVATLLEDRPVYIFDRMTGEDETFYRMFFQGVVEDLRNRGKIVVAVVPSGSEFFALATQLWEIREGEVIRTPPPSGSDQ